MADELGQSLKVVEVLLVYYSSEVKEQLERGLQRLHLKIHSIDGRAPDASELIRTNPSEVVIMDQAADDVSVTQAVRQIGQILPDSMVITMYPGREMVEIYRRGHRIGTAERLETALHSHAFYPKSLHE
ncbi:MAG: hypothetical protein HY666_02140 [Chloroflexi bacterium]|nr:hypothetical protein [Chloroflexota bacterium]